MEEAILKVKLNKVKNDNFILEEHEKYVELTKIMMKNIGSLDSELRDNLIYDILSNWILEERLNEEDMKKILITALDDSHIFYKIKDKDVDAVYTRSFSMLIIALIIYVHRKDNFLDENEIFDLKDKILAYMENEEDLRGYVLEKGWAHSMAHGADVLDELANCICLEEKDLMDILHCIRGKMTIYSYVYIEEENERMVNAVESVLKRRLIKEADILTWLGGFQIQGNSNIEKLHSKVNCKGFLRSLYFRLLDQREYQYITKEIINILKNL